MAERRSPKKASKVVAERVRAVREAKRWHQQDLADRLAALGAPTDRATVARTENSTRGLSLDDMLLYAAALDVSPLHLFIPLEDDQEIQVTPTLSVPAARARKWVRGHDPLPNQDPKTYRTELPRAEWDAWHNTSYGLVFQYVANLVHEPGGLDQATLVSRLEEMVEGVKWTPGLPPKTRRRGGRQSTPEALKALGEQHGLEIQYTPTKDEEA